MTRKAAHDVIGDDGRVRVLTRRCGNCLFRRGQPFGAGRAAEVIEANVASGALLTCHTTLPYGAHPDFGPAVCAGFWARHGMQTAAGRIAGFMLGITRINPPEDREAAATAAAREE
jgi:hypothetical protein